MKTISIKIDIKSSMSKHEQIYVQLKSDILSGNLVEGDKLPSITNFSKSQLVSRDTVEKAYNSLKKNGLIKSAPGKGNYVDSLGAKQKSVLMVFNKLSSYKKEIYEGFIKALGHGTKVDLQIFHYDFEVFKDIMNSQKNSYDYCVVMPHFSKDVPTNLYIDFLNTISPKKLIVLDKEVNLERKVINVYQDFKQDVFETLIREAKHVRRYNTLVLVLAEDSNHPPEIIDGISQACKKLNKTFTLVRDVKQLQPEKGAAYIMLTENEMAILVKKIRTTNLILGTDVGLLSFNETILKELLGISVVSTDFHLMGKTAADLIASGERKAVRNLFGFFKRSSF